MSLKLITAPVLEPITLQEAKDWIRYEDSLQNDAITSLIKTARREVEAWTNVILIDSVYEYYVNRFTNKIKFPISTVQSSGLVVTYQDTADVEQTVDSSVYGLDNVSAINELFEKVNGAQWPCDVIQEPNAVKISFTAGFGALQSDVPDDAKTVIKLMVSYMFINRESYDLQEFKKTPAVENLLNNIANYRF